MVNVIISTIGNIFGNFFETLINVFSWIIVLNLKTPTISIISQIIVKYGTWIITYSLVGAMFKFFGLFESKIMRIAFFVLSTIISFALSWVFMILENYLMIIAIIIGSLILAALVVIIIMFVLYKKRTTEVSNNA